MAMKDCGEPENRHTRWRFIYKKLYKSFVSPQTHLKS